MQTVLQRVEIKTKRDDSVLVYLLNQKTPTTLSPDTKICGLRLIDWLKKALDKIPYVEFDYLCGDIIEFLKSRLVESKYIVVLSSLTPLITQPMILKIIDYVINKDINACKFNGGLAFKVDYLKTAEKVQFDSFLPLNEEDNMVVTEKNLKLATKILQDRIIQKHISNGVEILGNIIIDEPVEIGKNCMIFNGNTLKGCTRIGDNCILKENNIIEDSNIFNDVCISSSSVANSTIEENVFILPYCFVNNATIRKNCYVSSNNKIENRTLRKGTRL